jgi:tetratricopeptide (TPR) repeat protein
LGLVSKERFDEARSAGQPDAELLPLLNQAHRYYLQALELIPPDAVSDLAMAHNQLGDVYNDACEFGLALLHLEKSIRYKEASDDFYGAAGTRYNAALVLIRPRRFAEARQYAEAALRTYQQYGDLAADKIQQTQALIQDIDRALYARGG